MGNNKDSNIESVTLNVNKAKALKNNIKEINYDNYAGSSNLHTKRFLARLDNTNNKFKLLIEECIFNDETKLNKDNIKTDS